MMETLDSPRAPISNFFELDSPVETNIKEWENLEDLNKGSYATDDLNSLAE